MADLADDEAMKNTSSELDELVTEPKHSQTGTPSSVKDQTP
jgi:hypothetical protein